VATVDKIGSHTTHYASEGCGGCGGDCKGVLNRVLKPLEKRSATVDVREARVWQSSLWRHPVGWLGKPLSTEIMSSEVRNMDSLIASLMILRGEVDEKQG
jgi:hypothetical protein